MILTHTEPYITIRQWHEHDIRLRRATASTHLRASALYHRLLYQGDLVRERLDAYKELQQDDRTPTAAETLEMMAGLLVREPEDVAQAQTDIANHLHSIDGSAAVEALGEEEITAEAIDAAIPHVEHLLDLWVQWHLANEPAAPARKKNPGGGDSASTPGGGDPL